ncbi:Gfo/Idh/MocA family protein [Curtobacterium sp. MCPF17_046]|uniref:Gfo/Idh/MocA family protein n=1 Tax=Curtobacterium sp. MCPF17_046 TaxID=2175663 RepID=UPI000D90F592|nr:Gfo/Idh/MocA family oxidoreductase [Curtobacterium sp. MCPF17_046]PYY39703.1 gfo/Idh/MocA family oxidoreductase [Curtobacterium sp. MCPF17_046]
MQRSPSDTRPSAVVLGAAHWHAPLYRDGLARRFRVTFVQDARLEAAQTFAAPLNVPTTTSVEEALNRDHVDVAFVFSPHHEMLSVSRELLRRGIPFVIEKPAGTHLEQLLQLEQDTRLAGVAAAVPLVQRGAPVDTWLRQAGDIYYERMAFIAGPPARYQRNGNPWMLEPTLSGGGSLMNLGPHFIDMAIRHIGHPADSIWKLSTAMHGEAVDDHATMVLTTSTGREAIVEVGYAFPDSPLKRYCSFTAAGTNGFASVDTTGSATFTDNGGTTTAATFNVDSDPLYDVFVNAVADTLGNGFAGLPTLAELVATMEVIWAPDPTGTVSRG